MSGAFDIPKRFLRGFYNDDAYFNSPLDYLPQTGGWRLDKMRGNYYVLVTGNGDPLLDQSVQMARLMGSKNIPNLLDVWDGFGHDWPWWQKMARKFFA
jgi:esterase/lipase superfamily enzyme